jgi:hypothetical protein
LPAKGSGMTERSTGESGARRTKLLAGFVTDPRI